MRKQILACAAAGLTTLVGAAPADMKTVEKFLEPGGCYYNVGNSAAQLSEITPLAQAIYKFTEQKIMENPDLGVRMQGNMALNTIKEVYGISGLKNLSAYGTSSIYTGDYNNIPLFRTKQIMLNSNSEDSLLNVFADGKNYTMDDFEALPQETLVAMMMNINTVKLYDLLQKISLLPPLIMMGDAKVQAETGASIKDWIDNLNGSYNITMTGDRIYVLVPDNSGLLWALLEKELEIPQGEMKFRHNNVTIMCDLDAKRFVMEMVLEPAAECLVSGKSLKDSEEFQALKAQLNGVESGNMMFFVSRDLDEVLWCKNSSIGSFAPILCIGQISNEKYEVVGVSQVTNAGMYYAYYNCAEPLGTLGVLAVQAMLNAEKDTAENTAENVAEETETQE